MKNLEISYLMDFYGNLLSDKQQNIMQLYYQEDLSLAEIAAEVGITRQGVRDNIVRAEKELINFESALGLWKKFARITDNLSEIRSMLQPGVCMTQDDYNRVVSLIDEVERDM
ncbi:MAG: YlxM family DNA-binding protein [Clostridia bacterium]|nr:YlxM family DNA-binding protein [Clostridia bacterium]